MKKAVICFWLNACLFFNFIILAATGFILEWGFPQGRGRGFFENLVGGAPPKVFLGIRKSAWGEIHFAVALILILLAIIHIVLYWDWIVSSLKSRLFSQQE
jgi:hypothetical protein